MTCASSENTLTKNPAAAPATIDAANSVQFHYGTIEWCRRRDLNPRPPAYEADALPLSYAGTGRNQRNSRPS